MTAEQEKRLILLTAIVNLGGGGSKNAVLDEVERLNLLKLVPADREVMVSRNELRWRNNLAFIRKHLVMEGLMSDISRDSWAITESGKVYLRRLKSVASMEGEYFRYLNYEAYRSVAVG